MRVGGITANLYIGEIKLRIYTQNWVDWRSFVALYFCLSNIYKFLIGEIWFSSFDENKVVSFVKKMVRFARNKYRWCVRMVSMSVRIVSMSIKMER